MTVCVRASSAFYATEDAAMGANWARFAFCKRDEVIDEACRRLLQLTRPPHDK